MVIFYFVGDVEEWVLDRMLNLVYKYKLVRKDKVGFMLNYIWWIFRDYKIKYSYKNVFRICMYNRIIELRVIFFCSFIE